MIEMRWLIEMKLMMNIRLIVYKILSIIERTERTSKIEMKIIEMIVWELILFLIDVNHCMNFLIDIDRSFERLIFLMRVKDCENFLMREKRVIVSENSLLLMTRDVIWSGLSSIDRSRDLKNSQDFDDTQDLDDPLRDSNRDNACQE